MITHLKVVGFGEGCGFAPSGQIEAGRASDAALHGAMMRHYGQSEAQAREAAAEWLTRYPDLASGSGWKSWKSEGDRAARIINSAAPGTLRWTE